MGGYGGSRWANRTGHPRAWGLADSVWIPRGEGIRRVLSPREDGDRIRFQGEKERRSQSDTTQLGLTCQQ